MLTKNRGSPLAWPFGGRDAPYEAPSAATSLRRLRELPGRILETLLAWQERARQRHALARLDDRMLRDIGASRADVEAECAKPFWRC